MKRIFIAIKTEEELQGRVLEWRGQQQVTSDMRQVRWIAPKNLHVTLVPPWNTEELKVQSEKLKVVKSKPFDISFNKISFGPNEREPRMIWLSGEAGKEILDLRFKILDSLGQKPDARPFKLHVTLARFKSEDFRNFETKKLNEIVDWRMRVKSFVLMESHLLPSGADYEVLEQFELKA
jgi:2'-5' RNA ligase